MTMKIKINGYRLSHRNRWLLLKNKVLTREELFLWEFYLDQMDFDYKHDTYGTFEVDFSLISEMLGYKKSKPNNSIRNKHKKLLKLGFIRKTNQRNIYSIYNPERYISQTSRWKGKPNDYQKDEMNKPISYIIQNIATNIQLNEIKFQNTETNFQNAEIKSASNLNKKTYRDLSSSKGIYQVTNNNSNNKCDYSNIESELSKEDVKLIRESIDEAQPYLKRLKINGSK